MKTKFLKDQGNIIIKLTDDKIINITGMIGSGKSTLSDYFDREKYLVFNLDCLSNLDLEHESNEMKEVKEKIHSKYENLDYENHFKEYYNIIYNHICDSNKEAIIEGGHIFNYLKVEDLKGTLIICLPSICKCWYRSINRHFKKYKLKLKNKEITVRKYISSNICIIFRRTKQIKYYKKMNTFLKNLEFYFPKINIGIDFDGTITNYRKFEEYYFFKQFGLRVKNPLASSFEERFEISKESTSLYKKDYFENYFDNVKLRLGVKNTIKKLKKHNNINIFIITNRSELRREYIEGYLKKKKIVYDKLFCLDRPNSISKLDKIKELKIYTMIEDNPYQIESISSEMDVICIDDIYNVSIKGKKVWHANKWRKIPKILSEIFKEKQALEFKRKKINIDCH